MAPQRTPGYATQTPQPQQATPPADPSPFDQQFAAAFGQANMQTAENQANYQLGNTPGQTNWGDVTSVGQYLQSIGSSDDPSYWVQKWNEWGQADPTYFQSRIAGTANGGAGAQGGTGTPISGDWFDQVGAAPDPYNPPATPANLQQPYQAPTFIPPTVQDLYADPGYAGRLDAQAKTFDRSAAAKGTLLSGGTLAARDKAAQTFGSNEYANLYSRYLQSYQDDSANQLGARQQNNSEFQSANANSLNTYGARLAPYNTAVQNQFQLANLGLNATTAGRPAGT